MRAIARLFDDLIDDPLLVQILRSEPQAGGRAFSLARILPKNRRTSFRVITE